MAITTNSNTPIFNFHQHFKNYTDKYGGIFFILLLFGAFYAFITWNAMRYIERADNQAAANLRIGNLEGKMEVLLQANHANTLTPTAIPTPTEPTQLAP